MQYELCTHLLSTCSSAHNFLYRPGRGDFSHYNEPQVTFRHSKQPLPCTGGSSQPSLALTG